MVFVLVSFLLSLNAKLEVYPSLVLLPMMLTWHADDKHAHGTVDAHDDDSRAGEWDS